MTLSGILIIRYKRWCWWFHMWNSMLTSISCIKLGLTYLSGFYDWSWYRRISSLLCVYLNIYWIINLLNLYYLRGITSLNQIISGLYFGLWDKGMVLVGIYFGTDLLLGDVMMRNFSISPSFLKCIYFYLIATLYSLSFRHRLEIHSPLMSLNWYLKMILELIGFLSTYIWVVRHLTHSFLLRVLLLICIHIYCLYLFKIQFQG